MLCFRLRKDGTRRNKHYDQRPSDFDGNQGRTLQSKAGHPSHSGWAGTSARRLARRLEWLSSLRPPLPAESSSNEHLATRTPGRWQRSVTWHLKGQLAHCPAEQSGAGTGHSENCLFSGICHAKTFFLFKEFTRTELAMEKIWDQRTHYFKAFEDFVLVPRSMRKLATGRFFGKEKEKKGKKILLKLHWIPISRNVG